MIKIFYKAATSSRWLRNILTPVGAIFFLTLILFFIFISLKVDKFLGLPELLPAPLNIIVSLPILAIGVFFILWSILHFFKARGTPVPFNPPQKLVNTGPYAYVRNPMLTGLFILLFGLGILFRSIGLTFIFTPLFILLDVLELKKVEEKELEMRFGEVYLEYKKRTPMFIPRLPVKTKK